MSRAIALNGVSSSGKSTVARMLQTALPGVWVHCQLDHLTAGLPALSARDEPTPDEARDFVRAFEALRRSHGRTVRHLLDHGVPVIVDTVLQGGISEQSAWTNVVAPHALDWVQVEAPMRVILQRETVRRDRPNGLAAFQQSIHDGIRYAYRIDTDVHATVLEKHVRELAYVIAHNRANQSHEERVSHGS